MLRNLILATVVLLSGLTAGEKKCPKGCVPAQWSTGRWDCFCNPETKPEKEEKKEKKEKKEEKKEKFLFYEELKNGECPEGYSKTPTGDCIVKE